MDYLIRFVAGGLVVAAFVPVQRSSKNTSANARKCEDSLDTVGGPMRRRSMRQEWDWEVLALWRLG